MDEQKELFPVEYNLRDLSIFDKDPEVLEEYYAHIITSLTNSRRRIVILLLIIFLFIASTSLVIYTQANDGHLSILILIGMLLKTLGLATLVLCSIQLSEFSSRIVWWKDVRERITKTELVNIISFGIFLGLCGGCLHFLGRVIVGECQHTENIKEPMCNPLHSSNYLPPGFFLNTVAILLSAQLIFDVVNKHFVHLCWAVTWATFIACHAILKFRHVFPDIITLTLFTIGSLTYVNRSQTTFLYFLQKSSSQREAVRMEMASKEMETRMSDMAKLMGNVSHDLKTPMQALSFEVDTLHDAIRNIAQVVGITRSDDSQTRGRVWSDYEEKSMISGTDVALGESSIANSGDYDCSDKISAINLLMVNCDESVKTLKDTISFMMMTVNRCLNFCKASSGLALVPANATCHLVESITWAVNCVRRSQERVNIRLCPVPDEICSHVITDYQWLVENILCLTSNAVKFTMEGDVEVRCFLSDPTTLMIEVEDHGIGISAEKKSSLFQEYQQAQSLAGGTGLGLYSMRKRQEALGGSCGVVDRKDGEQGSCFWFTLPYRPDGTIHQRSPKSSKRLSFTSTASSTALELPEVSLMEELPQKSSLLLVEDSIVIQKSISRVLRRHYDEVELASNGLQGLELLQQRKFDLVLMDLQMPIMDGLEATRRLREFESANGVSISQRQRIIGISANSDHQTLDTVMKCGMDSFLAKPFSMEKLEEAIIDLSL